MTRFLTDEQAAYLSQLYTGTDAPKLHKAPTMYVHDLERRYAERGDTIQWLERTIRYRNKGIAELEEHVDYLDRKLAQRIGELAKALMLARRRGVTIHRLERKLHKANRKHRALHRAMHDDTERVRGSLIKAAERLAQSIITPAPVEWPCFEDREPVMIGNWIAAEMGPFKVGSILFCDGHVLIYDEQHFHYVKLRDGEFAEHDPYGRR